MLGQWEQRYECNNGVLVVKFSSHILQKYVKKEHEYTMKWCMAYMMSFTGASMRDLTRLPGIGHIGSWGCKLYHIDRIRRKVEQVMCAV